jgi:peptidoglycan/LPS O-acetylase OafA/YrhL
VAAETASWAGRRIDALTSLRFFAAMGIVLGHFQSGLPLPAHHATQAFFLLAGSTVALFFVLSGFVLTLQYDGLLSQPNAPAVRRYALARLARIAPMYWLVLLLTLLAYAGTGFAVSLGGDGNTPGKAVSFIVNALALQAWVPSATVQQFWNAPGWSISAEVFFYALLPLLLRLRWLSGSLACVAGVLVAGWLLVAATALALSRLAPGDAGWALLSARAPLLGLPAFLLGMVLARRHMANTANAARQPGTRAQRAARSALWPVLLLALTAWCLVGVDLSFERTWLLPQALWVSALFGWLIWSLADDTRRSTRWLAARPLVLLGDASYALYLIHWLPLGFLLRGYFGPGGPWLGPMLIAALVLLSILLHLGFEAPMRRVMLRRAPARANAP